MACDRRTFLGAAAAATFAPALVRAQEQPLRIVVPFSAGSGTDVTARVLGDAIVKSSWRTVIVDNKPGAGTVLGSVDVARSRPDGNTVLYTTGGYTTSAGLIKKLPFDPVADLLPITRLALSSGFALLVGEKSPYRSLAEFVAAAKARPGQLSFGSSGVGNTTHVMGVFFGKGVGVDLLHVPFKGSPTNDLLAGTVDCAFLAPSTAGSQIRAGRLRALGISGGRRSVLLPEVATFAEQGFTVEDIPAWSGLFGPGKMAPDAVHALHDTIVKAARTPALIAYMRDNGDEPDLMPPEPFRAYVTAEIGRYRRLLPPLDNQIG